jgi:hypothetical protein
MEVTNISEEVGKNSRILFNVFWFSAYWGNI